MLNLLDLNIDRIYYYDTNQDKAVVFMDSDIKDSAPTVTSNQNSNHQNNTSHNWQNLSLEDKAANLGIDLSSVSEQERPILTDLIEGYGLYKQAFAKDDNLQSLSMIPTGNIQNTMPAMPMNTAMNNPYTSGIQGIQNMQSMFDNMQKMMQSLLAGSMGGSGVPGGNPMQNILPTNPYDNLFSNPLMGMNGMGMGGMGMPSFSNPFQSLMPYPSPFPMPFPGGFGSNSFQGMMMNPSMSSYPSQNMHSATQVDLLQKIDTLIKDLERKEDSGNGDNQSGEFKKWLHTIKQEIEDHQFQRMSNPQNQNVRGLSQVLHGLNMGNIGIMM